MSFQRVQDEQNDSKAISTAVSVPGGPQTGAPAGTGDVSAQVTIRGKEQAERLKTLVARNGPPPRKNSKTWVLLMALLGICLAICSVTVVYRKPVEAPKPVTAKTVVPVHHSAPSTPPPAAAPAKDEVQLLDTSFLSEKIDHIIVPKKAAAKAPADDKARPVRNSWEKFITVTNSNYAYGVIGGISNLSVLFRNETDYDLDEVTAKVTYIKSNGKPWVSKMVSVYNIPAHSERKMSINDVNRGKSVSVAVAKILSHKMHFVYPAGVESTDPSDPYFKR